MTPKSLSSLAVLLPAFLLAACGGGGGGDVVNPNEHPPEPVLTLQDPNIFLTFPNPQKQADGTIQTTAQEYAEAYYRDVDPLNERDTVAKYKAKNGIEFSPGPNGGVSFPKFYNFNGATGQRQLMVSIDGRSDKAMPSICISCHGGRGDPLTPPDASGKRHFPIVANGVSQARGDVQAHLHPIEADAVAWSDQPGFTRAEQEATLKVVNKMILCTYPKTATDTYPEDACRRDAGPSEWQGTAAAMLKAAYGGPGMPNATFSDTYVPDSWLRNGQSTLYRSVVATSCRACHVMRGVVGNSDLDFTTYEKFVSNADRMKIHVIDRGNMPLVKLIFDRFWGTTTATTLGNFLQDQGYTVKDSAGNMLMPGRPLADPGPDRVTLPGATPLNGSNSLYANAYAWSIVSGPAGASIANANSAQATFNANTAGTYIVQLVTSNGSKSSTPAQLKIVVNPTLSPAPSAIRFANIKSVIQGTCVQCHSPTGNLPRPPVFWADTDRNGDGAIDATDNLWLYTDVRGRINFTELGASPLLRKPSGHHHGGLLQPGFDTSLEPGDTLRANYDLFVNWILNGAPM